jgi:hypothetical protein
VAISPLPWIRACGNSGSRAVAGTALLPSVQQLIIRNRGHRRACRSCGVCALSASRRAGSSCASRSRCSVSRSIKSVRKDGFHTEMKRKSDRRTRCRRVAYQNDSMSSMCRMAEGTAMMRRTSRCCSPPTYSLSSANATGMPDGVTAADGCAGLTAQ